MIYKDFTKLYMKCYSCGSPSHSLFLCPAIYYGARIEKEIKRNLNLEGTHPFRMNHSRERKKISALKAYQINSNSAEALRKINKFGSMDIINPSRLDEGPPSLSSIEEIVEKKVENKPLEIYLIKEDEGTLETTKEKLFPLEKKSGVKFSEKRVGNTLGVKNHLNELHMEEKLQEKKIARTKKEFYDEQPKKIIKLEESKAEDANIRTPGPDLSMRTPSQEANLRTSFRRADLRRNSYIKALSSSARPGQKGDSSNSIPLIESPSLYEENRLVRAPVRAVTKIIEETFKKDVMTNSYLQKGKLHNGDILVNDYETTSSLRGSLKFSQINNEDEVFMNSTFLNYGDNMFLRGFDAIKNWDVYLPHNNPDLIIMKMQKSDDAEEDFELKTLKKKLYQQRKSVLFTAISPTKDRSTNGGK